MINYINVLLIIFCIVLLATQGIAGEKASYGLKVGVNFAKVDGDVEQYVGAVDNRNCMTIGGFALVRQFGDFYLQPEFL